MEYLSTEDRTLVFVSYAMFTWSVFYSVPC